MKKVKSTKPQTTKFSRQDTINIGKFTISKGDIIKIDGIHGTKYQFDSLVTNTETGKSWVDCFELEKGKPNSWCSFYLERVKRIPTKRGKKNVA